VKVANATVDGPPHVEHELQRGAQMGKLAKEFSKKEWKKCCGKGCGDCKIAQAYIDEYGKKEGKKRLKDDNEKMNG
jgi:hypothetical protein